MPRHRPLAVLLLAACHPADDSGAPPEPAIEDVAWALHEDLTTLVDVTFTLTDPAEVRVEFRPTDDADWLSTPSQTLAAGPASFLLLGLPHESDFVFRVLADFGAGATEGAEQVGATGAWPEGLPVARLNASDPERYDPTARYLITSVDQTGGGWQPGTFWKVILDRQGRTVWALKTPSNLWTTYMRVAENGEDLLYDAFSYYAVWDGGAASEVHRIKIDGSLVHTYATPGGQHAYADLPDGSIAWGASGFHEEHLDIVDLEGDRQTLWDCMDFQDERGIEGDCKHNSLSWDAATDSFLYSLYTSASLVQIQRAGGATLRVFGETWGDYAFDPEDSAFWWQHGAVFTDAGTLLLSTHTSPDIAAPDQETVVREYAVDDESMTLTQIWSFGVGEGLSAQNAGEAHRLANGDTLQNLGTCGIIREITPAGKVVWDVDWREDAPAEEMDARLVGRSVFVEDLYAFAP
ncbi:MAG: aryl-sulfate sulfotransferase [Pseudomonadota bacterium]